MRTEPLSEYMAKLNLRPYERSELWHLIDDYSAKEIKKARLRSFLLALALFTIAHIVVGYFCK
jgi:hypothetical protein